MICAETGSTSQYRRIAGFKVAYILKVMKIWFMSKEDTDLHALNIHASAIMFELEYLNLQHVHFTF